MADITEIISKEAMQAVERLDVILKGMPQKFETIATSSKKLNDTLTGQAQTEKQINVAQKQATADARKLEAAKTKLNNVNSIFQKKLALVNAEYQKNNKELKQNIAIHKAAKGSYDQLNVSLNKNIARYKSLSDAQRNNSKEGKQLLSTIKSQDSQIKKLDSSMGRSQRNVGNYSSAFRGLGAAMGVSLGLFGIFRVIKNSIKVISDFDSAMKKVESISGATADELKNLKDTAEKLGKTTVFTATEVAGLELELSKLGFTSEQIVAMSGGITQLSAAFSEELGKSAEITGNTLRAFGLEASDTQRVVDVMSLSFASSALNLDRFSTAMATVAPVAKTFGFSLEETTALLAQLVNAGFDASMAGTALRNILLNLANTNGALAKKLGHNVTNIETLATGLIDLRKQGVSLNTTLELTDKRSVAAFNQFLQTAEGAVELKNKLEEAGGTAQSMADIQLQSVENRARLLKSAWEGLILEFSNSKGAMSTVVNGLTEMVSSISFLVKYGLINPSKEWVKEQDAEIAATKRRIEMLSMWGKIQKDIMVNSKDPIVELTRIIANYNKTIADPNVPERIKADNKVLLEAAKKTLDVLTASKEEQEIIDAEQTEEQTKELKKRRDAHLKLLQDIKDDRQRFILSDETTQDAEADKLMDALDKELELILDKNEKEVDANIDKNIRILEDDEKTRKKQEELLQAQADRIADLSMSIGEAFGAAFEKSKLSLKSFLKESLILILSYVEKSIQIRYAEILANEVATKSLAGIITASIEIGLITAAFEAAKAGVQGFEGGVTNLQRAGIYDVGEGGTELIKMPGKGMMLSPGETTRMFLPKGTDVIPHDKTVKVMHSLLSNKSDETLVLNYGLKQVENAIREKDFVSVNIDENGFTVVGQRGAERRRWIDKYIG